MAVRVVPARSLSWAAPNGPRPADASFARLSLRVSPVNPKLVSAKELQARGYVQEANRLFFHPLGLALAVETFDDGTARFHGIIDGRADPDGFVFDEVDEAKAAAIGREWAKRAKRRQESQGFVTQPVGPYEPHPQPVRPPDPPKSVLRRRPFSRRPSKPS